MRGFVSILCLLFIIQGTAQSPTIGLKWNEEQAWNGYTLFSPMTYSSSFLINNCGEIVNEWSTDRRPYYTSYLLENGDLARISITTTGARYLERRDWDGNTLWEYQTLEGADKLIHSDFQVLPNGNYLVITALRYDESLYLSIGGNEDNLNGFADPLYERIVEFQPIDTDSAAIVWHWSFIEHLIQDISDTLPSYGIISENPQLLNINHPPGIPGHSSAYQHFNGIDYNAELDQIAFSCWGCSEVYIIDHSTSIDEASSHTGGNSGKGGDLLWRWGNPRNYNMGDSTDQRLFGQHNPTWLGEDTPYPGFMSIHDNGNGRPDSTYSRALIIPMHPDSTGNYIMEDGTFLPDSIHWQWQGEVEDSVYYSQYMSTMDVQPNGNVLICEAVTGRFFEVTADGEVVWFYQNPVTDIIQSQGNSPTLFSRTYRIEKYDSSYAAFIDKDLNPQAIIEDYNWVSDSCTLFQNPVLVDTSYVDTMYVDTMYVDTMYTDSTMIDSSHIDTTVMDSTMIDTSSTFILEQELERTHIYPNPCRGNIWVNDVLGEYRLYELRDVHGKLVRHFRARSFGALSISDVPSGSYFLSSISMDGQIMWTEKIIFIE